MNLQTGRNQCFRNSFFHLCPVKSQKSENAFARLPSNGTYDLSSTRVEPFNYDALIRLHSAFDRSKFAELKKGALLAGMLRSVPPEWNIWLASSVVRNDSVGARALRGNAIITVVVMF